MRKTATIALALLVGLAVGIPLGGRLMPAIRGDPQRGAPFSAVRECHRRGRTSPGPHEVVPGWPKDLSTLPGHDKWTFGGARGILPRARIGSTCIGGGELPNIPRPATKLLPEIGPNVQFPLAGLPWRNANAAVAAGGRRVGPGSREGDGALRGRPAVSRTRPGLPLGALHSSSWTRRATSSRSGRSGTRCSSARTPSTSAPTMRRSTCGWSTITRTRSTSSRTTASSWCRRSARRTFQAPMRPTSTGRRSWRGCPTGASTSPTAITARASRSSTRRASSCWISACAGDAGKETRPGYMNNVHGVAVDRRDAARVRQRSRQPPHPDLRRERQIPLRVEDRRQPVEPPLRPDRRGSGRW